MKKTYFILTFLLFGATVFAAPPGTPYAPAETLDPGCSPGDVNCEVSVSFVSSNADPAGNLTTANAGDMAYDTTDNQMQYFDGTNWAPINTDELATLSCTDGQVIRYNSATSAWTCSNDNRVATGVQTNADPATNLPGAAAGDTAYDTTDGEFQVFDGTNWGPVSTPNTDELAALNCTNDQVARYNSATSAWTCSDDNRIATGVQTNADPATNLPGAAAGDTAYDTTDGEFQVFDGTNWVPVGDESATDIYAENGVIGTGRTVGITDTVNFDSGTFLLDGTNNRAQFGVGTARPARLTVNMAGSDDGIDIRQPNASSSERPLQIVNGATSGVSLYINHTDANNPQGAIRIDGAKPEIEFVETDQAGGSGKWEIQANGGDFGINSRKADDSGYEKYLYLNGTLAEGGQMVLNGDTSSGTRNLFVINNKKSSAGAAPGFAWENSAGSLTTARLSSAGGSGFAGSDFRIQVADSAKALQERLRIDVAGNVGIGTASPSDGSGSGGQVLKLDTAGAIGATHYCDEDGLNCVAAGALSSGGSDGDAWAVTGEDTTSSIGRTGNVGIGETNPINKLHIKNNTGVFEVVRVENSTAGGSNIRYVDNASTPIEIGSENGDAVIRTNSTVRLIAKTGSGNVGIGTTTPSDGSGSGGQALKLDTAGAIGATHYCDEDGLNCVAAGALSSGGSDGDAWAVTGEDTTSSIGRTGNVGIGTSTPQSKLDITAAALGTNELLRFAVTDGTYNPRARMTHVTATNNQYVEFDSTYTTGVGFADWVFMDGNVGIGTTSPTYKLEVSGANSDASINGIRVGRGAGDIATNTVVGGGVLASNTTGNNNVASGYQSLYSNTAGYNNVASGYQSLYSNTTGAGNVALGYRSLLANTTGGSNTASGFRALRSNTTGAGNVASGYDSLFSNTTGNYNQAMGYAALQKNTTGSHNTGIGPYALQENTTGASNHAMGYVALQKNTTGNYNQAIGYAALQKNTTGGANVGIGHHALYNNTTGSNNVTIGYFAGENVTTGGNNIIIGANTDAPSAIANDQLNIGNWIYGAAGNIGIGTATPSDGSGSGGQALKLDAEGAIGATHYCDKDGLNCVAAADLSSGGGGGSSPWTESSGNVSRATGNVGIGTASPARVLHLEADSAILRITDKDNTASDPAAAAYIEFRGNDGQIGWFGDGGSTSNDMIALAENKFQISTGGSGASRLLVDTVGNVGIGTASPSSDLHVNKTGSAAVAQVSSDTASSLVLVDSGGAANEKRIDMTNDGGQFYLRLVNDDSSAKKEALSVTPSGDVLIGGTGQVGGATPRLSIQNKDDLITTGDYAATEILQLHREGTSGNKWSANAQFKLGSYSNHLNSRSSLEIGLTNVNNDSVYNTVMTMNGDGAVGIGTSAPLAPLTVKTAKTGAESRLFRAESGADRVLDLLQPDGSDINDPFTWVTSNAYQWRVDAVDAMTIDALGKVGIGTTTPLAKLHAGTSISDTGSLSFSTTGALISATSGDQDDVESNVMTLMRDGTGGVIYAGAARFDMSRWEASGVSPRTQLNIKLADDTTADLTTALSLRSDGNVGIGTTSPSHRLHVIGTAGLSTGTAWTNTSDARLKDIQGNYENGLDEVLALRTVRFNYKKDNPLDLPSDTNQIGFVAQEVREVIPEAVTEREDGYLELNVDPIHWAMVNAVKEQQAQIQALKEEINQLKSQ